MGLIYFFSGGFYHSIEVEKNVEQLSSSEVLTIIQGEFPDVKDIVFCRVTCMGNLIVEEIEV